MFSKGLTILVTILVIVVYSSSYSFSRMVSVKGNNVNLRSGPGTNYPIKWEYGDGFPVKILKKQGNWLHIEDFENDTGWLHNSLVSESGHLIVKVNKGSDTKINIRSGPGTNYQIVGKAHYGVVFETITQRDGWAQVEHESGLTGWVKRSLLWGF